MMDQLIGTVFILAVVVGLFIAGRALVLWYLRINEVVDLLQRILIELKSLKRLED